MNIKTRKQIELPNPVLERLGRLKLNYTNPTDLFCVLQPYADMFCGVFGDGENGGYEWFIWNNGILQTSNAGYGGLEVALRDVLIEVV